jgi:hypothetical protein
MAAGTILWSNFSGAREDLFKPPVLVPEPEELRRFLWQRSARGLGKYLSFEPGEGLPKISTMIGIRRARSSLKTIPDLLRQSAAKERSRIIRFFFPRGVRLQAVDPLVRIRRRQPISYEVIATK